MVKPLREVIIERDGLDGDEADQQIEMFKSDLDELLEKALEYGNAVEILLSAESLMESHFGLEPDYLDEFIPL